MKKFIIIIPLLLASGLIWFGLSENAREAFKDEEPELAFFETSPIPREVISIIKKRYPAEEVSDQTLLFGAMDGMLGSLDPFSEHLDKRRYVELQNDAKGEFGGVGILASLRGDFPKVIKVMPGSPADKAGVSKGDELIRIDNESCFRKSVFFLVERLRGPIGSQVSLSIRRKNSKGLLSIKLERTNIIVQSVRDARIYPPDVAYIKLTEFVENSRINLDKTLTQLLSDGAKVILLDLRNNMGGTLESAVSVSSKFLGKGNLIVKTKGRTPEDNASFYSDGEGADTEVPLFILVNRTSASASEIVAGSLKDQLRATVLGEKTFGKGSVQTLFPLSDGSAVRMTTAYYMTPGGAIIDNQGIQPSITIDIPEDVRFARGIEDESWDPVLEKALEIIRAKKKTA